VCYQYDDALYTADRKQFMIPVLIPSLLYVYEVEMVCNDPSQPADSIRIIMLNTRSAVPFLTAMLKMPVSEMDDI
jgi:hypothetical protein